MVIPSKKEKATPGGWGLALYRKFDLRVLLMNTNHVTETQQRVIGMDQHQNITTS